MKPFTGHPLGAFLCHQLDFTELNTDEMGTILGRSPVGKKVHNGDALMF